MIEPNCSQQGNDSIWMGGGNNWNTLLFRIAPTLVLLSQQIY